MDYPTQQEPPDELNADDVLKEKDAEIEQLKAIIEDLSDHRSAAERMQLLKALYAEIQHLNSLISRAADALDRVAPYVEQHLIAELRMLLLSQIPQ